MSEVDQLQQQLAEAEAELERVYDRQEELEQLTTDLGAALRRAKAKRLLAEVEAELRAAEAKGGAVVRGGRQALHGSNFYDRPEKLALNVMLFTPPAGLRVITIDDMQRRMDISVDVFGLSRLSPAARERLDCAGLRVRIEGGEGAHRPTCPEVIHWPVHAVDPDGCEPATCCVEER